MAELTEAQQARVDTLRRVLSQEQTGLFSRGEMIVAAYIGSKSHGTYVPPEDENAIDDVDIMGVFFSPLECLIGMERQDHWHCMYEELDVVFNSVNKFMSMCAKGSPNVLPLLYLKQSDYLMATEFFLDVYQNRSIFMSKRVGDRFFGYADSQLQDMRIHETNRRMGDKRKKLVEKYGYDVKAAAHAMRLLTMSYEIYSEGIILPDREAAGDANIYIAIKKGEWPFKEVKEEAGRLYAKVQNVRPSCKLPKEPDHKAINDLLMLGNADWILRRLAENASAYEAAQPKSRLILPGQF